LLQQDMTTITIEKHEQQQHKTAEITSNAMAHPTSIALDRPKQEASDPT
jgi:hypothetical protein